MPQQKNEERWNCPDCNAEFPSRERMQAHGVSEHGWEEEDVEAVPARPGRDRDSNRMGFGSGGSEE